MLARPRMTPGAPRVQDGSDETFSRLKTGGSPGGRAGQEAEQFSIIVLNHGL